MSEVKDIFENEIAKRAPNATDIDAIFAFNITGDDGGKWVVDLKEGNVYAGETKGEDADCTIEMAAEDFVGLVKGTVPGPQLFMMGKLKIGGNMGLAMKLGQVVGQG